MMSTMDLLNDPPTTPSFELVSQLDSPLASSNPPHNDPVTVLPPEILSQIFYFVKGELQETSHYFECSGLVPGWTSLSAVCQHWRNAALQSPRLWNTIDFKFPKHAEEWLARSKLAPLEINARLPLSSQTSKSTLKTALSDSTRISALNLAFDDTFYASDVLPPAISSTAAPSLERMRLALLDQNSISSKILPVWHDMPLLCTLHLYDVRVPSQRIHPLPCLTELIFSSSSWKYNAPISWLVCLLNSTPALEVLEVYSLSRQVPSDLTPSMRVSLPRLTSLRLKSTNLVGLEVYHWIDFPGTTHVSHRVDSIEAQPDLPNSVACLQMACSRISVDPNAPLIHEIRVSSLVDGSIQVQLFPSNADHPDLHLVLPLTSNDIALQLLFSLPFQHADTLVLEHLGHAGFNDDWKPLFTSLTHLTSLELSACGELVLQHMLKAPETTEIPMPLLETLTLVGCVLNLPHFCDALIRFIDEREEHHLPLNRLVILKCDVSSEVIEDLQEHIDVECDNVEIAPPLEEDRDRQDAGDHEHESSFIYIRSPYVRI
ncbi:hypothetical protein ONZ45_g6708 [Pleurotus djamor]|nr:hypothetical protein ONZ45_g6708 [Pleurotus djamor]